MTDTEARIKGIGARNEAAKRGKYPGDIPAGFRLLRRDVEFLIEQNAELRRVIMELKNKSVRPSFFSCNATCMDVVLGHEDDH